MTNKQKIMVFIWLLVYCVSFIILQLAQTVSNPVRIQLLYSLSLIQLIVGLVWAIFVSRQHFFKLSIIRFQYKSVVWLLPLLSLIIIELSVWIFTIPRWRGPELPTFFIIKQLAYFLIIIALVEELWYRGIWFAITGNSILISVILGSILFTLLHWHQGLKHFPFLLSLGLVFSVCRWLGSPIWSLAISHGLMNWLNITVMPSIGFRFGEISYLIGLPMLLFCLAALLFYLRSEEKIMNNGILLNYQ